MIKIEAVNVKKSFISRGGIRKASNGGPVETLAVGGVNLKIEKGEFHVILGPSGCGKSSFLDLISGLTLPTEGTIFIDGKAIEGPGPDRAVVFQQYALLPWRTALGNIEFALENQYPDKKKREEIGKKFISLVGLRGFEDHYPHELSGGMKQRVSIARALALHPDILLMDEPFAAVDAQTRETLQRDLLRIATDTEKTIVFITHSIDEAVFLADRVSVMTARPGIIKSTVDVLISRHERLHGDIKVDERYIQIRHQLWKLLKEEVVRAQSESERSPANLLRSDYVAAAEVGL